MGLLLAFLPFIAFAALDILFGVTVGLVAAGAIGLALLLYNWRTTGGVKILDVGSTVLFGGLGAYALVAQPEWSIFAVKMMVDAGLVAIVLLTMLVGAPFTLQYARESVPEALWNSPEFIRTNYVITGVWALAFAVMFFSDYLLAATTLPHRIGVLVHIAALVGAYKFTKWYPDRASKAPA